MGHLATTDLFVKGDHLLWRVPGQGRKPVQTAHLILQPHKVTWQWIDMWMSPVRQVGQKEGTPWSSNDKPSKVQRNVYKSNICVGSHIIQVKSGGKTIPQLLSKSSWIQFRKLAMNSPLLQPDTQFNPTKPIPLFLNRIRTVSLNWALHHHPGTLWQHNIPFTKQQPALYTIEYFCDGRGISLPFSTVQQWFSQLPVQQETPFITRMVHWTDYNANWRTQFYNVMVT